MKNANSRHFHIASSFCLSCQSRVKTQPIVSKGFTRCAHTFPRSSYSHYSQLVLHFVTSQMRRPCQQPTNEKLCFASNSNRWMRTVISKENCCSIRHIITIPSTHYIERERPNTSRTEPQNDTNAVRYAQSGYGKRCASRTTLGERCVLHLASMASRL